MTACFSLRLRLKVYSLKMCRRVPAGLHRPSALQHAHVQRPTVFRFFAKPFKQRGRPNFRDYAAMVCVSTRTPTPIVDETATFFKYTPLLEAGLAFCSASISAARLPCSL